MDVHFPFHQLSNTLPLMDNIFPRERSFPGYCRASVDFHKVFHLPSYRQIGPELAKGMETRESLSKSMDCRGTIWRCTTLPELLAAPSTSRSKFPLKRSSPSPDRSTPS